MLRGVTRRRCLGAFALLFFMAIPHLSYAQVVVTEVMYDLKTGSDSGREWIEVYNAGAAPVKLTDLRLFENGTNHKIAASAGNDTLAPGSYAVIADNAEKFKIDWPNFSGVLFDSTFSLGNFGETIAIRTASSTDIDTVPYQSSLGGAGDGNSLNRVPGGGIPFIPRTPSPGAPMSASAVPPPPPKQSAASAKSIAKRTVASQTATEPVAAEETTLPAPAEPDVQMAGAAEVVPVRSTSAPSYLWWLAALTLALLACGAMVAAKHVGKKEWNIVEDTSE